MTAPSRSQIYAVAAALIFGLSGCTGSTSAAPASSEAAASMVNACFTRASGAVRIVTANSPACSASETALAWRSIAAAVGSALPGSAAPGASEQPVLAGAAGAAGAAGQPGQRGEAGSQGLVGLTGLSGAAGSAGANGSQGTPGTRGVTGQQGLVGLLGLAGAQGLQGITGLQGVAGLQGIAGLPGSPGFIGPVGATGPVGLPGTSGSQGLVGQNGTDGLIGLPGRDGHPGLTGEPGTPGVNPWTSIAPWTSTIAYQTGPPANVVSYQGGSYVALTNNLNTPPTDAVTWAQIAAPGLTGPMGIPGAMGPAGPAGLPGEQGAPGVPGQQGDRGDVGPQGVRGPTGPAGPAATAADVVAFNLTLDPAEDLTNAYLGFPFAFQYPTALSHGFLYGITLASANSLSRLYIRTPGIYLLQVEVQLGGYQRLSSDSIPNISITEIDNNSRALRKLATVHLDSLAADDKTTTVSMSTTVALNQDDIIAVQGEGVYFHAFPFPSETRFSGHRISPLPS